MGPSKSRPATSGHRRSPQVTAGELGSRRVSSCHDGPTGSRRVASPGLGGPAGPGPAAPSANLITGAPRGGAGAAGRGAAHSGRVRAAPRRMTLANPAGPLARLTPLAPLTGRARRRRRTPVDGASDVRRPAGIPREAVRQGRDGGWHQRRFPAMGHSQSRLIFNRPC